MKNRRKSSKTWVYIIWGLNGMVLLVVVVVAVLYSTSLRASAADEPVSAALPTATRQIPPTGYFLPTLTPNLRSTVPSFEISTPFVLADGPRPTLIGYSLAARPIEVYTFGEGKKE